MMPVLQAIQEQTPTISVGILTADLLVLGAEITLLEQAGVGLVHFDVMDGVFCPMMTFGPPVVKAVRTPLIKDVHLLIQDPLTKVKDYAAAGADIITVHAESSEDIGAVLREIGGFANANDPERGIVRGLALNPGTPVESIEPLLGDVDMVTVLAVVPGVSSKFLDNTIDRLAQAREIISRSARDVLLCLDGGVKKDNIGDIAGMGADIVVTGSAVFDGKDVVANARYMLDALREA